MVLLSVKEGKKVHNWLIFKIRQDWIHLTFHLFKCVLI